MDLRIFNSQLNFKDKIVQRINHISLRFKNQIQPFQIIKKLSNRNNLFIAIKKF